MRKNINKINTHKINTHKINMPPIITQTSLIYGGHIYEFI